MKVVPYPITNSSSLVSLVIVSPPLSESSLFSWWSYFSRLNHALCETVMDASSACYVYIPDDENGSCKEYFRRVNEMARNYYVSFSLDDFGQDQDGYLNLPSWNIEQVNSTDSEDVIIRSRYDGKCYVTQGDVGQLWYAISCMPLTSGVYWRFPVGDWVASLNFSSFNADGERRLASGVLLYENEERPLIYGRLAEIFDIVVPCVVLPTLYRVHRAKVFGLGRDIEGELLVALSLSLSAQDEEDISLLARSVVRIWNSPSIQIAMASGCNVVVAGWEEFLKQTRP